MNILMWLNKLASAVCTLGVVLSCVGRYKLKPWMMLEKRVQQAATRVRMHSTTRIEAWNKTWSDLFWLFITGFVVFALFQYLKQASGASTTHHAPPPTSKTMFGGVISNMRLQFNIWIVGGSVMLYLFSTHTYLTFGRSASEYVVRTIASADRLRSLVLRCGDELTFLGVALQGIIQKLS